ncbi:MAG TPA: cytochrome c [Rhodanobacteraceae bacterium]|jgi:cytochrome c553|nr:cytochrome c [Rhodanobacteraceae bacterium]
MTESNRKPEMTFRLFAPLALALLVASAPASAKGDAEAGKTKSATCQACHGPDGNAGIDPQYPRLAGQYADYIARALHEYKTDNRKNPIMKGFATTLSDADIDDLAAYYSTLPGSKLTDLHGHVGGD